MATGRPVAKTLIEYNINYLEENDEEKKEPIDIEFTEQNADHEEEKKENTIDFKWSNVQKEDEEDIALANFIENYKSKLMRNFFSKKQLDDCGIAPNEKKN